MLTEFGLAWLIMGIAFGVHVTDEATHDFLAWYNPIARSIRARIAPLPFPPVFTFWPWLLGLAAVTTLELSLTPVAARRPGWICLVALVFSTINVGNGLLHIVAAIKLKRQVPGVLSAPLLLAAALWLLTRALGCADL